MYKKWDVHTDGQTDGRTDKAKTICPADLSQAGHKNVFFLNGLKIFMSLYGLYLRNPSTDLIFLLYMERTYIGAV